MLFATSLATLALPSTDYASLFSAWKAEYGKAYATADLESKAFSAFAHNEDKVRAHNVLGETFELGHNEFSDLTADEFFATKLGYARNNTNRGTYSRTMHMEDPNEVLASSVDWVSKGAVTPVKNQQQCGGCWAFSATGSMEGALKIATGTLTSLSEEDLIQCNSKTDSGCGGGLMDNAFKWVESNGIAGEKAYPYTSGSGITGKCKTAKERKTVAKVGGYTDVQPESQSAMMSAVSKQPVSIAIEADKSVFQLYKKGVMSSKKCGTTLDHGVLVVGFDSSASTPYWTVKNSWGATWGEKGYIRLGMAPGKGICGMLSDPSYPTGMTKVSEAVEAA